MTTTGFVYVVGSLYHLHGGLTSIDDENCDVSACGVVLSRGRTRIARFVQEDVAVQMGAASCETCLRETDGGS